MLILYLAAFIKIFFDILSFLVIVRVLLSWFPHRPHQGFFDLIFEITDPILGLAKKIIPPLGMVDLSPIIVLFALNLLKSLLLALFS